ncbi:SRPBCC family protein [Desulfovibrio ferrophilus]|uniref:SRPBCC family protein n=1 Tax=Desulfovibrio ferrophilus TaxID=241368 RepID=A0A2Z6AVL9_9BACT|nr:SRPBCC family protein [Desulfovibrio ferrophilus]BBD07292.1 uncharacterized protein DFE_0566 [Desulfovibrio ferrophilus]
MNPIHAKRFAETKVMTLLAPPQKVFPLLCPVREYEWVPHWHCKLLHTESGLAHKDCAFTTNLLDLGHEVWTCTRYEPPRSIEYVRFAPLGMITRLTITLGATENGGTRLIWELVFTAISDKGEEALEHLRQGRYEQTMTIIEKALSHYLRTGEMLSQVDNAW